MKRRLNLTASQGIAVTAIFFRLRRAQEEANRDLLLVLAEHGLKQIPPGLDVDVDARYARFVEWEEKTSAEGSAPEAAEGNARVEGDVHAGAGAMDAR